MKVPQPYKCDYCPKLKGETNHWWLRDVARGRDRGGFALFRWDDHGAAADRMEHICGMECAAKALAKWMAAQ